MPSAEGTPLNSFSQQVVVSAYDWASAAPVTYLCGFSCLRGHTNSLLLPIPKGDAAYRVEVSRK